MTFNRDGAISRSVADGFTPTWGGDGVGFGENTHEVFPIGAGIVPPDATAASQFGLPSAFPGFLANVVGTFTETILYSQMEGQTNRRAILGSTIYSGFGTGARHVPGGSRWFSGANETEADPARLIRLGKLPGVDSIWEPIHHSPLVPGATPNNGNGYVGQYAASTGMQCLAYTAAQLGRAADVRVTWGAGGAVTVQDLMHNVPVGFKPSINSAFAAAMFSIVPRYSRWTGATISSTPTSGGVMRHRR
jgi:hypothetical protein